MSPLLLFGMKELKTRRQRFFSVPREKIFLSSKMMRYVVCVIALVTIVRCAPSDAQFSTPTSPVSKSTSPISATTPSTIPTTIMPTATLSTNKNPIAAQLVSTLELATNEMRAAESATTLDDAKLHAEAAVNILVGKYGRWYGDQNGDNQVTDPSDKRGVLPGEKLAVSGGADIDTNAQFPYGLALMAGGTQTNSPALQNVLGDVVLWRTRARGGYDSIASAIAQNNLAALQGTVPRSVAYVRLILTTARTLDEAHQLATFGVNELDSAMQAARTLAQ